MKKKLKVFFGIVGIIVLAVAGYLLYIFNFKTYDVADDEVEQIVANPYEIELPDGNKLTLDESGEVVAADSVDKASTDGDGVTGSSSDDEVVATSGNASVGGGVSGNSGSANGNPSSESTSKPTVASIKQKYTKTFEALQAQADSKLNALVGRAKSEFNDKKANGDSIDFGYFYNKYTGAANGLEAQTDAAFNGVMKALEQDLQAHGFNKSYAQSFRDEYEAKKKERRDSLISKALGNS